jgi:beta-glucosidase
VASHLAYRQRHWATLNEPLCIAVLGYLTGEHAPGHKDPTFVEPITALHNSYLAHGKAIPLLRANVADSQVGIVFNMSPILPATDSEADQGAAQRFDVFSNRLFVDPILKGEYPPEIMPMLAHALNIQPGDMELMSAPLDYIGLNYYSRNVVAHDPESTDPLQIKWVRVEGSEYTEMGWEIYPDGLRQLLVRIQNDYHPKAIYVTENGCASPDVLDADGVVHDPQRVSYLASHFRSAHQAIEQGVPLKGYFAWSLMDNFEWSFGYAKRFGLIYVDYPTQQRIPKDSYRFYQQVIRDNGLSEA